MWITSFNLKRITLSGFRRLIWIRTFIFNKKESMKKKMNIMKSKNKSETSEHDEGKSEGNEDNNENGQEDKPEQRADISERNEIEQSRNYVK